MIARPMTPDAPNASADRTSVPMLPGARGAVEDDREQFRADRNPGEVVVGQRHNGKQFRRCVRLLAELVHQLGRHRDLRRGDGVQRLPRPPGRRRVRVVQQSPDRPPVTQRQRDRPHALDDELAAALPLGPVVQQRGPLLEPGVAAGHPHGFSTQLIGNDAQEIPAFAAIVQQAAKAINVDINVKMEATNVYYGKATFGNSDWLDATMSLVDYGHRSVPNVFLTAPLQTISAKNGTGSWNAARFNNTQYDKLSAQYIAAVDLTTQKSIAGQIETLLLAETPIIYAYFYNYLTAQAKNVTGAYPTAIGHIFLNNCKKS